MSMSRLQTLPSFWNQIIKIKNSTLQASWFKVYSHKSKQYNSLTHKQVSVCHRPLEADPNIKMSNQHGDELEQRDFTESTICHFRVNNMPPWSPLLAVP